MMYNVGDKVLVRPDLSVGMLPVVDKMVLMAGKIATIKHAEYNHLIIKD